MSLIDVIRLSETICVKPICAKLKYATVKNFVGRRLAGYHADVTDVALLTPKAANQLCMVQNYLVNTYGYGLLIYDAYRPLRAGQDIWIWSTQPPKDEHELARKAKHYPGIQKNQLFDLGFVARDSGHSYGNTVDVVLIDSKTEQKLDMGAGYDYFGEKSHIATNVPQISAEAYNHRQILSKAMQHFGFESYDKEFWHFSHGGKDGREVTMPFDIEITPDMRGIGIRQTSIQCDISKD